MMYIEDFIKTLNPFIENKKLVIKGKITIFEEVFDSHKCETKENILIELNLGE